MLGLLLLLTGAGNRGETPAAVSQLAEARRKPSPQLVIFSVALNGERIHDGLFLLRRQSGDLLVKQSDLKTWRLRLSVPDPVIVDGEVYFPVESLPGVEVAVDEERLHLDVQVVPDRFATTVRSGRQKRREHVQPRSDPTAFLNYELSLKNAAKGDAERLAYRGLFDLNLTHPARFGNLRGVFQYQNGGRRRFVRLGTSWTRDLIERRETIVVGDAVTAGGSLGPSIAFGGVRWSTKFEVEPYFLKAPQLEFTGSLEQSADIEILINDLTVWHERLPPGGFEIHDLPPIAGSGEAGMVITDLADRRRMVTRRFIRSPRLLKAGLSHFSCAIGFERRGFGTDRYHYDRRLFAAGTLRRGFTNRLTGELHGEAREDLQVLRVGGIRSLPGLRSILHFNAAASRDSGGSGSRIGFAYDLRRSRFSLLLSSEWTTDDFRQLGDERAGQALARLDSLRGDVDLGKFGGLGLSLARRRFREQQEELSTSVTYHGPLGPGRVFVSAFGSSSSNRSLGVRASYVLRIGRGHSVRLSTSARSDSSPESRVEMRKHLRGKDLGWTYRLRAGRAADRSFLDGSLTRKSRFYEAYVSLSRRDETVEVQARVAGSLTLLGGRLLASRRIDRGLAMVEIPDQEGVEVLLENRRVGKTNKKGVLLLPDLNPYQANRVGIDPTTLPIGLKMDVFEKMVAPHERGGLKVAFDAGSERNVMITLVDSEGAALPPKSLIRSDDGKIDARVARNGLVFLAGVPAGTVPFSAGIGRRSCRFTVEVPKQIKPLEHLGEIVCR